MSILALSFSLSFVLLAVVLSRSFKLGLEKDVMIAMLRAAVQLIVIGYILNMIFGLQQLWVVALFVLLMIGVAAANVASKGKRLPRFAIKVFATFVIVELLTQAIMLGLGIIPATARYIIPISGMIIGNSMVLGSLLISRLRSEVSLRQREIQVMLSLGATPRQAILPVLKSAIRSSMIPTIDGQKTIGLVQLPGMMTGQIIAGADPITAVRFQLLIVFTLMTSAIVTSILLGLLIAPSLFNKHQQLQMEWLK
ncbi:ABC transporter permease [Paenibacillus kandeliae]|uniref:ABC transporter permease n=1 Tax=Paenibacillus kandeliae TaxID=3231269 RepID=UPI003457C2E4